MQHLKWYAMQHTLNNYAKSKAIHSNNRGKINMAHPQTTCTNCGTTTTRQPAGDTCHACLNGTMKPGRIIDYIGGQITLTPYTDIHRPQNQKHIDGIPLNPVLRVDFEQTPNDEREDLEISDWWSRPFIQSYTWDDMRDSYDKYRKRVAGIDKFTPITRQEFNREQQTRRDNWYEAWPNGTRYDVQCLDGGAWDRSTNWAMVGNMEDAITCAKC